MLRPFTLCLAALLLSSCEPVDSPAHLTTSVIFRYTDGTPDANAEVNVIESFGGPPGGHTTDIGRTDRNGRFELNGDFCLPVEIYVAGGAISITSPTESGPYVVDVREGLTFVNPYGPVDRTRSRKLGPRERCD
jgi:hypothetical protein